MTHYVVNEFQEFLSPRGEFWDYQNKIATNRIKSGSFIRQLNPPPSLVGWVMGEYGERTTTWPWVFIGLDDRRMPHFWKYNHYVVPDVTLSELTPLTTSFEIHDVDIISDWFVYTYGKDKKTSKSVSIYCSVGICEECKLVFWSWHRACRYGQYGIEKEESLVEERGW